MLSSVFKAKKTTANKKDIDSTPIIDQETPRKFSRVFNYFDENGDGKISSSELHNGMKKSSDDGLSFEELEKFIHSIDSDGDGMIGYEEFAALVEERSEDDRRGSVREAFEVYRETDGGNITAESLRTALGRLGDFWSVEECKGMIRRFDVDGDGVISLNEFENMLLG